LNSEVLHQINKIDIHKIPLVVMWHLKFLFIYLYLITYGKHKVTETKNNVFMCNRVIISRSYSLTKKVIREVIHFVVEIFYATGFSENFPYSKVGFNFY